MLDYCVSPFDIGPGGGRTPSSLFVGVYSRWPEQIDEMKNETSLSQFSLSLSFTYTYTYTHTNTHTLHTHTLTRYTHTHTLHTHSHTTHTHTHRHTRWLSTPFYRSLFFFWLIYYFGFSFYILMIENSLFERKVINPSLSFLFLHSLTKSVWNWANFLQSFIFENFLPILDYYSIKDVTHKGEE